MPGVRRDRVSDGKAVEVSVELRSIKELLRLRKKLAKELARPLPVLTGHPVEAEIMAEGRAGDGAESRRD